MHEADTVIDRTLADVVGREEAVDVVGAQVRDHFRRGHRAQLHIGLGIESVLGEIVPQQVIVHGIVERDRELQALPVLRVALVLVLGRQHDALPVDVLDRRDSEGNGVGTQAQRDRDRHRRQHVCGVVFLVDGLVADHRPAGGLHHFDVEAVLGIEAHRRRHDDRRGAGDRNEADLEVFLLGRASLRKHFRRRLEREELRHRSERRGRTDRFQECAACHVLRKHRAHHRGCDHTLVALLLAFHRLAAQGRRGLLVLQGRAVLAANAARLEIAVGIKRIVERGHAAAPLCHIARRTPLSATSAQDCIVARPSLAQPDHDKHAGSMPPCLLPGQPPATPARSAATGRATIRSRSRSTSARPSRRRSSVPGTCWKHARP